MSIRAGSAAFKENPTELLAFSATTYAAAYQVTPLCNNSCSAMRWSAGTIAFLSLALLALVEGVARVALAALALGAYYATFCQFEMLELVGLTAGAYGALLSFESFVQCLAGCVTDFSSGKVEYHELVPCLNELNESIERRYLHG